MTREQLVTAEAIKMNDARRMASDLRAEAHDDGHERIESAVRRRSPSRRRTATRASAAWSPLPTT